MVIVIQGCVSGIFPFHKAICHLKNSAAFCLASSSQNNQKSNVMQRVVLTKQAQL